MEAVTVSNSNSNSNSNNANNHHGSTKKFFIHTLEHLTSNNIITPYTRDKLIDMINSEGKRDFARVRKHVLDLLALHDAFDSAVNSWEGQEGAASGGPNGNGNGKQPKKKAK